MIQTTDKTHDPKLKSWVASASAPETDFPVQNLPLGVFHHPSTAGAHRIGVAIGDQILDLVRCAESGLLDELGSELRDACLRSTLNQLMALGREAHTSLRRRLSQILSDGSSDATTAARSLLAQAEATMVIPAMIGDYTDFYASVHHATNVGGMFRPDNPLLPNYKHIPIGYHGRASSIIASGTPVQRPVGQTMADAEIAPRFGPSKLLDYELELAMFIGRGNALGRPIPIESSEEHLFGISIMNDWSARDIQKWEYQPLGPFLAKNFATTVSPWIVTLDALVPYRIPAFVRPPSDPAPLPYLTSSSNATSGGFAITLEVMLVSQQMRESGLPPILLSRGSFKDMYWTFAQMVAHHASNGCNLRPGDLLGSGTVSGATKESRGCLLELTWRGNEPIALPTGETRGFLQDGDEVIMRGYCEREGFVRIGFGECRGVVLPAGNESV